MMKKVVTVILLSAMLLLALCACDIKGETKNFNNMYSDYSAKSWCTIGADGSYMRIDTNPKDKTIYLSDLNDTVEPAMEAIERVNKELGFGDSLMAKMNSTTWSQGQQTDSNDNYKVSWTYHPDKGLEVMYEFK